MNKRPLQLLATVFIALSSMTLNSCRPHKDASTLRSDTSQDKQRNLVEEVDERFNRINSITLRNAGLVAILRLTYVQLMVLGKLPFTDIHEEMKKGLVNIIAKEELAFYGAPRNQPVGLLKRTHDLAADIAEAVQVQSMKQGLLFKIQLMRAVIEHTSDIELPQSRGKLIEDIEALTKAIDNLPA